MMVREPQIVAFGGGGFSMEPGNPLLDEYVLSLTGSLRPKVCFLPSASGDADHYVVRFYKQFADRADASHITLFRREAGPRDLREHLLSQDLIYVGGGSLVSLLGVWRAHGIDVILRDAWARGVVLCGLSAGALCWFDRALTAYYGAPEPIGGMGFLPWSFTAHYDSEPERREEFHRRLAGGMSMGFAADDGAALHFRRRDLLRAVSSKRGAAAYSLRLVAGEVLEQPLDVTFLGDEPCPPLRPPLVTMAERLAPAGPAPPAPPAVAA
ncbi:MAG: Type 1 glutamine amidotransferase-like domain-containing protein [Solirubrobacterales bacterium]